MRSGLLAAIVLSLPLAAQDVDFKFLDKLADKAKESSVVDLGPDQLGLVKGMFGGGHKKGDLTELAKNLRSMQVRSYEFEKEGDYSMDEVRAFRDKVKSGGQWVTLISTREKREFTDILIQKGPDGKPSGFLIIAAEPRELSIVHIVGSLDLSQLGQIGGQYGVPRMESNHGSSGAKSTGKAKEKDEDEM